MEEIPCEANVNLNNYFCLICCNKIDPRKKNFKHPNILDGIFLVLSNYMKWNNLGKQFQCQSELFPFCHKCTPKIENVSELNEQVHRLLRRIDQLCANISADILLSRNKFERILKTRNLGLSDHGISGNKRNKCTPEVGHFDMEKVCKYRTAVYKRFTASVTLERRDKSIAEISQIPKGPLRKRKCSVKVEIPMLSESETVLKESMGSMEMESYDMNSSAVGDFKCEIESEKRVKNDAVKKDVQGYQNSVTMKGRAWKCGTCRLIFPSKGKFDSHILSSCHGVRRHVAKKSINLQNADGSLLSIALSVFKDSRKNLPTVDNAVVNHLGKCMSTKIKADNCFETHYLASSEECHQDQNVENKKETEKYSVILKDRIFKSGDKCFSESEEAKVDRCVETDNENYQPRSSESFEESGEDLGIEILPRNNDNSLVECEGSRRNKPKRRSPNFRIWKLADKIKQIDATHFVFDEKFPFEINDGVWKCGTCGLDFRTKRYLNSHLLSSCLRGSLKRYKFLELPEGKFKYGGHVFQKSGDDNFICAECDHVAETQEKVMGHIRSKHLNVNSCRRFEEIEELPASKISYAGIIIEKSGDKFKCSDCFQTAGTQAELVNHIRSNHMVGLGRRRNLKVTELGHNRYQYGDTYHFEITDIGLFRCLTCDMHCHRRHRITEHIFVCHIQKRFQKRNHHLIETSPNEFLYAGKYRVTKNGEDQYECVNCTIVYNRKTIITHLRHRHLNPRKYTCTLCEKTFPAHSYLDEHMRNTHVKDRPFVCDSCGQSFKTKSILMHHIKCRHAQKTNICTYCGKGFSLAAQLQSHLKVHTGIISNPTICEVCGKELPKSKLKDHMVIHGEPPFSCTDCNKKFYNAKSLKAHIATHGGAKPHPCKLCSKAFAFQTGLKYHIWRCHSEQTASLDNKRIVRRKPGSGPYPCDICGRGFFEKRKIQGHKIRYHSELTPELDRKLKEKLSKRRSKIEIYDDGQDFCNEFEIEVDAE